MEARDQMQHRAKAKLRKAVRARVSAPPSATPNIQSWLCGIGDGAARSCVHLTRGDLPVSVGAVGGEEETTTRRCTGRSRIIPYERRSRVTPVEQRG